MILVNIPGYCISEKLYNGSRTVVYRGYRKIDSLPVVVKLLKNPYPNFSELVQFRNQYNITKNLNSSLIIQTYSLEPYQNSYVLVMEDFDGVSLNKYFTSLGKRYIAPLKEFLVTAIALCDALDILYRERIIHKDIKPSNILINPQTKQVKLIDFSIASLLPRETQTLVSPNVLEGTLAYLSPEQTGRMNRGIDYRTDFYSLGITFYELLTGELPFKSTEPMELVHCHIAKMAPLVHEINLEIPLVISKIVSKLMAKNAEDRYQSALGLKYDLEKCLHQLQETARVENFEIARRDVCERFIIPDKLYGRETEVSTLLQAFDRVSFGATEIMLVAGFSGIGKTAVVNEVHKPIVQKRGYFIKGKYDQFQRNIPLSAFVQAFRDLIRQLLTESDVQLEQWKNKILSAVGENGQVIIEVIPELEIIIGQQVKAIELSGTAAQNRFNLLFQKFTQVFTSAEHPLVIFLDDLQWADTASLKLMQLLMADSGHLFMIGAYRDNEVHTAHPLILTLDEIAKSQARINTITLAPLSQVQVNNLVVDTLKCTEESAWELSVLIYQKTKGNPFFVTQFLKGLHQDGLIQFNYLPLSHASCNNDGDPRNEMVSLSKGGSEGGWQFDIAQVTTQAVTDDIVAFMVLQLQKLPPSTQQVLQLAACIGNQFDLEILAIVSEQSQIETASSLWKALQEGLILPIGDVYKFYVGQETQAVTQENQQAVTYQFIHDRVQQAAYSLIPDDQKQATHLQIGRLLLQAIPLDQRDEKIFVIVNHLNQGITLIVDESEQQELVRLNQVAGQKARSATAYGTAMSYFNTGIKLLKSKCWQNQYNLTLDLYQGAVECAYLNTDFEQVEKLAQVVLNHTESWFDRSSIYVIRIQTCIAQNQLLKALGLAREVLTHLGVELPEQPAQTNIDQALRHTQELLEGRTIESLLKLPQMTAANPKAAMMILSSIISAAYQVAPNLLPLIIFAHIDLSVQYGNAPESTYGYVMYGLMQCAKLNEIEAGYRFGLLGVNLLEYINAPKLYAKTIFGFYNNISHWKEGAKDNLKGYLQAYACGLETGDFEYVALSLLCYSYTACFSGQELISLRQTMEDHRKVMQQFRQDSYFRIQSVYYQTVLNLLEPSAEPHRLYSKDYDEDKMIQFHLQANQSLALFQLYFCKQLLSYIFQRHEQAVENACLAEKYLGSASGLLHVPLFSFYYALTWLAVYPTVSKSEQITILERVAAHLEKLQEWASHAPTNQAHRCALVAAEQCRVLGARAEAIEYYDGAIAKAKENEYIHEEALANELAAKFYLEWGKEKVAAGYMQEAYYSYARWGAKAKVADLESRYIQLLTPILQQTRTPLCVNETVFNLGAVTSTSSSTSISHSLDLAAILKASHSLSSEIELKKLLSSWLSIVIENAGADKCVLMLLQDDSLRDNKDNRLLIKGLIIAGSEPVVLQRLPIEDSLDIPLKLIYKVKHDRQTAVLIDATTDLTLANDPYIMRQQPKSILCCPIVHQGKFLGILYLENSLTTGAFTNDRVELLSLLSTQAAISLENARLYERSQNYAQKLQQSLDELSASNSRFHHLVDNVPGVVYQSRLTTNEFISLSYISADCYSLLEITPEQAMSNVEFLKDMVHPDDMASYHESTTDAIKTQSPWCWEGRIVTPSETLKWIHGESRIEKLVDGSVVWDGLLLDITTTKKAELALQQKSQDLQQALQDLQQAQLQMIQSEKMSALGNLVAGVAHEMNNPLGFIAASLKQAKPTVADIIKHLKLYQECCPSTTDEIIEHAEEIDLEYSLADLPKMLDSMTIACDRLKNISTSLRTFSRADRDYKVPFNIHQGIDSTILILKHRLKANEQRPVIEVITEYGNLPEIECFPGQLNQVFMNILANAIDALEESNNGRSFEQIKANPNRITITTLVADNFVKITIADNGKGIAEEVKQKIFDHSFTTKPVGKGTGLGLAIARQIVEETHSGKLSCHSIPEKGTKFFIEIPCK